MSAPLKAESQNSSSVDFHDSTNDKLLVGKIDPTEERRVVRKMDYYLIPMMTMFYLLSFLVSHTERLKPI